VHAIIIFFDKICKNFNINFSHKILLIYVPLRWRSHACTRVLPSEFPKLRPPAHARLPLFFRDGKTLGTRFSPSEPGDTPKKLWNQVKPILGPEDKLFPMYEGYALELPGLYPLAHIVLSPFFAIVRLWGTMGCISKNWEQKKTFFRGRHCSARSPTPGWSIGSCSELF
jgi:hypothetical protein